MKNMSYHTLEKSPINNLIALLFVIILLFGIIYMVSTTFIEFYWIDKQANDKARNPNNLTISCISFIRITNVGSRTPNPVREFYADNLVFYDNTIETLDNSPMSMKKMSQFYHDVDKYRDSKCYKVSYLHLDYILAKKTYIYDYFGFE